MAHSLSSLIAPLAAILTNAAMFAQTPSAPPAPVAYVYVDSFASQGNSHIYGFAAAPNGTLTPVVGSPYVSPVYGLAVNGKFLFGGYSDNQGKNSAIYSYSIAPNGSLKQAAISNVDPAFNGPVTLTLDHTGTSLYSGWNQGAGDNGYESFSVNESTGKLTSLQGFYTGIDALDHLAFIGNNAYAYGAACYHLTPDLYGFARMNNGDLSGGMNAPLPPAPPNNGYCPGSSVAADPYNDVVVPLFQYSNGANNPGKPQLAVYTADKYGNLTTTGTYKNMPTPAVEPDFLTLSPSGYYLAVMGYNGLQIFLMHGSNPPTALTGAVLPGTSMGEAFFDYHQHLYVLSTGKVYVFNISTNGITQAPGSPFVVPAAQHLSVLPK